jgi:hypothetical protein
MKRVNTVNATLITAALLVALLMTLSGRQNQKGPTGKSIDNAAELPGGHVENAGEAIRDAVKGDKR